MAGDQKPVILGLSIVFPIIAIVSVILRFESRRIKRLKPGADDWTILASLVNTLHAPDCPSVVLYLYTSVPHHWCYA